MKVIEASSHAGITLKNILFATDFSAASEAALPYAAAISRRYGSQLHLIHVMSPAQNIFPSAPGDPITLELLHPSLFENASNRMATLASQVQNLPNHTYIGCGGVRESLSKAIRKHNIDLLVVGTHGRTGMGKFILGSKAEEILRQAPCPVLTVGPNLSGGFRLPSVAEEGETLAPVDISVRQIVYATDFSPESLAAAPFATSLAQEFQAGLTLLHVMEKYTPVARRPTPVELALRRLEKLVPEQAELWCSPKPSVQFGSPADCILQEALHSRADLIVLGVRSATAHLGVATHLPWATAHKVIAQAHCPVLTVPCTAALEQQTEREGFYEFGEVML